jgi:phosphoribosyl 1,2-cyclic phosphodiesterase
MIDCGLDWIKSVARVRPDAIVLTHAHPDHAGGLKNGSPCPVYATRETLAALGRFDISDPRLLHPRRPRAIRRILFEAFPVEHSILAPAVGYRITAASSTIFYGPDLIFIRDRPQALCGIDLYIGDGATITRPLVRRRGQRLIGHTTVQTQLTWCQKAHIERAIITHCGSGIVSAHSSAAAIIVRMAKDRGLDATIAHDGLKLRL